MIRRCHPIFLLVLINLLSACSYIHDATTKQGGIATPSKVRLCLADQLVIHAWPTSKNAEEPMVQRSYERANCDQL